MKYVQRVGREGTDEAHKKEEKKGRSSGQFQVARSLMAGRNFDVLVNEFNFIAYTMSWQITQIGHTLSVLDIFE